MVNSYQKPLFTQSTYPKETEMSSIGKSSTEKAIDANTEMETTSEHGLTNEMKPKAAGEEQHTESRSAMESKTNVRQVNPAEDTSLQEEELEDQVKITLMLF